MVEGRGVLSLDSQKWAQTQHTDRGHGAIGLHESVTNFYACSTRTKSAISRERDTLGSGDGKIDGETETECQS